MSATTRIEWCDSTFNPWWGCTRISPGCDHCYAEALDRRTGGDHWRGTVKLMSDDYWRQPLVWNREGHRRVFCASMADVFDKNAPPGERQRLWALIRQTRNIDWLVLTKRVPNIERFLPTDWGCGYPNVWLGSSVENRKHGLPRISLLRQVPAAVRFLSCEPLLEDLGDLDLCHIHWVIAGGESGPKARPMAPEWVRGIEAQCRLQGVPFFFKQWGGRRGKGGCMLDGSEQKEWPTSQVR